MPTKRPGEKLIRSQKNKVLGGVCGGLGDYFAIDPIVFRILFVLLAFANGIGILAYLIFWAIVPSETAGEKQAKEIHTHRETYTRIGEGGNRHLLGSILIIIGILILVLNFFSIALKFETIWPLALIFIGIYLIFKYKE